MKVRSLTREGKPVKLVSMNVPKAEKRCTVLWPRSWRNGDDYYS